MNNHKFEVKENLREHEAAIVIMVNDRFYYDTKTKE